MESDSSLFPIDVKKGRGVLNSIEKFSDHNSFDYAIKISVNNYGYDRERRFLTIPFYFVSFLSSDLGRGKMRKKG